MGYTFEIPKLSTKIESSVDLVVVEMYKDMTRFGKYQPYPSLFFFLERSHLGLNICSKDGETATDVLLE